MATARFSVIKQHIEQQIEEGLWPPGARVPSENELGAQFKVSRMTARRALDELAGQGLLRRAQGLGTFVADNRPTSSLVQIRNIAEEITSRGHHYSATVFSAERVVASDTLAADFHLEAGSKLFFSVIVHRENHLPVQYEARYVNPAFAPAYLQQDFTKATPNAYLMQTAPLTEADHLLEAILVSEDIATKLGISTTAPCLKLTRKTWCKQGIVSLAYLIHPGDRYRLGDHLKFPEGANH